MKTSKASFGTHAISWEMPTDGADGSDSEMHDLVSSSGDSFKGGSSESDDQEVHELTSLKVRRTRAAPFFDELMPGWRARARETVPSPRSCQSDRRFHLADDADASGLRGTGDAADVSGVEELLRHPAKQRLIA